MKYQRFNFFIIILFIFVLNTNIIGQNTCLPEGIIFTQQEEIDNFALNYPGCTVIEGDVEIINPDILNLDGLNQLEAIQGDLYIGFTRIGDLTGLSSLGSISGNFTLINNSRLGSLFVISNLESIIGRLIISSNDSLKNITGLSNLKYAGGFIASGNLQLENISGFDNLDSLGIVSISSNNNLITLDAFSKIKTLKSLRISSMNNLQVIGFDSLTTIQGSSINSDLELWGLPNINNLDGISNIKYIEGGFTLSDLPSLESLPLFDSLKEVGRTLRLDSLVIVDFTGFANLETIGGELVISGMHSITDILGFDNLQSFGGLRVYSTYNLATMDGLSTLKVTRSIGIHIYFNFSLLNLNGLSFIDSCWALMIRDNPKLESVEGISNIIFDNDINLMTIWNNPLLSACSLDNLCPFLNTAFITENAPGCNYADFLNYCGTGIVQVGLMLDQVGDCQGSQPVDVRDAFFANMSQDGYSNSFTFPGGGGVRELFFLDKSPFQLSLFGFDLSLWDICEEEIIIDPDQHGDTIVANFILQPLDECPELTVDLGLPPNFRGCLVTTDMRVRTQNTGTIPAENVELAVVVPFDLMEVEASFPPPVAQNGDTLFFELGDLDIFETADVILTVRTRCDTFLLGRTICIEAFADMVNPCPPDLPLGSIVKTTASCIGDDIVRFTLTNIGDEPTTGFHHYFVIEEEVVLRNDTFQLDVLESIDVDIEATGSTFRMEATKLPNGSLTAAALEACGGFKEGGINAYWLDRGFSHYDIGCRQVILAYDPNDKQAIPTGVGVNNTLAANRAIDYTIRFQNTGTDTAYRVLLTDILPPELNVLTFRPVYASHDYTWEIRGLDTLEVLFSPITLPDSAASPEGSQGFFTFRMEQLPNLSDGTFIQNSASIIFDFNPPILTNTAFHTIGKLIVSIDQHQPHVELWKLRSNPMRDQAVFWSPVSIPGIKQFELYDLLGRQVRQNAFSGDEYHFQRGSLGGGIYLFRIIDTQSRQFIGKLVISD